jgi:hypothetical protein
MSASPVLTEQSPPTDTIAVVETADDATLTAQAPALAPIPASAVHVGSVKTELSFCLPTSLAFFKDFTWKQTPWIHRYTTSRAIANPITLANADFISRFFVNHDISPEVVEKALFFGSSSTGINFFVVIPYVKYNINLATDERFLRIWHDQIVKPAFDRAWIDSGLTPVCGAEVDAMTRLLPTTGTRTDMEALPAKGFIKRLKNGSLGSISTD